MAISSLCHLEKKGTVSLPRPMMSYDVTEPIHRRPPSGSSYLPHLPVNTITLGTRASAYEFGHEQDKKSYDAHYGYL